MTDGEQTKDPEATKSVNEILAEAVQPLKDKGVRVITLGIGKKVNKESLQTIATDDFVFYASSFNELRKMVKQLKKGTCPSKWRQQLYMWLLKGLCHGSLVHFV